MSRAAHPAIAGGAEPAHNADADYGNKGTKQWVGYKVHVVESVDPQQPAKTKAEPGEHFAAEILTSKAEQNGVEGLAEALKNENKSNIR